VSTVEAVVAVLRRHRYAWANETDVQAQLAAVLAEAGFTVKREVRLGGTLGRIDLIVDRIGIEVKVKGSAEDAARQLQRYAGSCALDALILATTHRAHLPLPATLGGMPVHGVHLAAAL
jgi:hypothetical protein